MLFSGAALLIALSVLVRAVNHDEGQYVAAIASMRRGWPYLDFPYLQTPLQPLALSPLGYLPAGWLYLSVRVVNGLLGLATLALTMVSLRGRVSAQAALAATTALLCTNVFLFASAEARNDALPMVLLAGAIMVHLQALDDERSTWRAVVAGLFYGLAASAKISFAIPAAAAALFTAMQMRGPHRRTVIPFLAGVAAGLAPSLLFALAAPAEFKFDVFTYSLQAPQQYWRAIGQGHRLSALSKIANLLVLALPGAMAMAFALVALDRRTSRPAILLDLLILGALISAYLPDPSFAQYWVPVLPPLFVRFGISLDEAFRRGWKWAPRLVAASCIAGLAPTAVIAAEALRHGSPIVSAVADSRAAVRLASGGRIVSLAPQLAAGADSDFDDRFVTGPFLFRTFGPLSGKAMELGRSPNWQRLAGALDAEPPALIVVGTERKAAPPLFPAGLDERLIGWARSNHYGAHPSPSRRRIFLTAPQTGTRSAVGRLSR